jgi:hypothetical protein
LPATHNAFALKAAVIALIADVHDCCGVHEAIADDTFAIALFAETTEGDARLFAAHNEIGVMLRHGLVIQFVLGSKQLKGAASGMRGAWPALKDFWAGKQVRMGELLLLTFLMAEPLYYRHANLPCWIRTEIILLVPDQHLSIERPLKDPKHKCLTPC